MSANDFEWFRRNRDLICSQIRGIRNHFERFTGVHDEVFFILWDKVQWLRKEARNFPVRLNKIIERIEEIENYSAEEWVLFGQIHQVDRDYLDTLHRVKSFVESYYHPGFDNE